MTSRLLLAALFGGLAAAPNLLHAVAPPAPPVQNRLLLFLRSNPLGAHAAWQIDRVYGSGFDGPGQGGHVGLRLGANGSYGALRLSGDWSPHPALQIGAHYRLRGFWGANSGLIPFASGDADYSGSVLDERETDAEAALGHDAGMQVKVRGRYRRFVPVITGTGTWYDYAIDEPFAYEPDYDLLLEDGDGVIDVRVLGLIFLLEEDDRSGLLGPAWQYTTSTGTDIDRGRIGIAGVWRQRDPLWFLPQPDVSSALWYNYDDRHREEELSLEIAAGFTF